jgi:hypothetical protein
MGRKWGWNGIEAMQNLGSRQSTAGRFDNAGRGDHVPRGANCCTRGAGTKWEDRAAEASSRRRTLLWLTGNEAAMMDRRHRLAAVDDALGPLAVAARANGRTAINCSSLLAGGNWPSYWGEEGGGGLHLCMERLWSGGSTIEGKDQWKQGLDLWGDGKKKRLIS